MNTENNLLKKVKLNALAGYLNFAITSLLVFFLSPYLIRLLGAYSFGVWKSIQKILTFATVADGKATQALKWVIANDEGNNDFTIKQQAIGSSLKVWGYFFPLMLLIIGLLVWNLPSLINDLDKSMYNSIYVVGLILGVNMLINPLFAIPDAILIGTNNGYKSFGVQIIGALISNFLMILVAYLGYGIKGLAFVVLLVTMLNAIFVFFICRRSIPWLGVQKPSKDQVKDFFGFSFWVFIWAFVQKLILSTEILLIGFLINPETVSNFVFTTYIVQLAISISLITGSSITPSLGKVIGTKEFDKAREITRTLREIIMFVAAFFGAIILFLNKDFVTLWMGEKYFIGEYSNLLIVLSMVHLVILRLESQIQDLSLKIKSKVIYGGVFAILSFLLAVIGYKYFDNRIEGLFLGILIGRILHGFIFQQLVDKMLIMRSDKKGILYLYLIIMFFLSKFLYDLDNWINLFFVGLLLSLFLVFICFHLFLSNNSKRKFISMIKINK